MMVRNRSIDRECPRAENKFARTIKKGREAWQYPRGASRSTPSGNFNWTVCSAPRSHPLSVSLTFARFLISAEKFRVTRDGADRRIYTLTRGVAFVFSVHTFNRKCQECNPPEATSALAFDESKADSINAPQIYLMRSVTADGAPFPLRGPRRVPRRVWGALARVWRIIIHSRVKKNFNE